MVLAFEIQAKKGKTDRYKVKAGAVTVGMIKWSNKSAQYLFYSAANAAFGHVMLQEISDKLKALAFEKKQYDNVPWIGP